MLRRLLTGGLGRLPWDFPQRRSGEHYLILVRPGLADDRGDDPGLSDEGRAQARSVAQALTALGPLAVVAAPLRRAVETAAPMAERWRVEPRVEPALAGFRGDDHDLEGDVWRKRVLGTLGALDTDTVVVAEVAVIDAVVGAATGDGADGAGGAHAAWPEPQPGSRTTLRVTPQGLQLLRLGHRDDGG